MESYRELIVWQKSMDLVECVYGLAKLLPDNERFMLSAQLCRAAVSIPSNIAEGYGRSATKEYIRFLKIARGSNYEVETQLLICVRLHYLSENDIKKALSICGELSKMLSSLITKLSA